MQVGSDSNALVEVIQKPGGTPGDKVFRRPDEPTNPHLFERRSDDGGDDNPVFDSAEMIVKFNVALNSVSIKAVGNGSGSSSAKLRAFGGLSMTTVIDSEQVNVGSTDQFTLTVNSETGSIRAIAVGGTGDATR